MILHLKAIMLFPPLYEMNVSHWDLMKKLKKFRILLYTCCVEKSKDKNLVYKLALCFQYFNVNEKWNTRSTLHNVWCYFGVN